MQFIQILIAPNSGFAADTQKIITGGLAKLLK
jgi:hypothetical protein